MINQELKNKLNELTERLKENGVVDVKFATARIDFLPDKIAADMILVLEAMLDGDVTPAEPIGDSVRAITLPAWSPVYIDGFSSDEDIMNEFKIPPSVLDGYNIIVAAYDLSDCYSGDAFILLEKDGTFYEVNASHCSCYGLEDEFDLEETNAEALNVRYRADWNYGGFRCAVPYLKDYFKR